MSKLKLKVSKLYKSKRVNVLAVFILLAMLFSLLTKLSKDYTRTISFDIEMLNVPDEHIVLNDSLHKINVTLSDYGFNLLKYYFVNPKLKVDFNELKKLSTHYLWTKSREFQNVVNQFNVSTTINSISPDSIYFNYDAYAVKTIPVVLNKDINFASGYDIDEKYMLQPDSLQVIGAKSAIDSIINIGTEVLTIGNVNSDVNSMVNLALPKINSGIKFSEKEILVKGVVKKFTEGSLMVPVILTNLPENLTIKFFPKEIEVTFYTSLDYYKTITSNNFKIECDYSKLEGESSRLIPVITKQPNKVRNVRLAIKAIEFIIL